MLEELASLESAEGKESFHAVARGGTSVLVCWKIRSNYVLELRCRRDGDGALRTLSIEGSAGSRVIDLGPEGSTWELTLGTGGLAFRALVAPVRVRLDGLSPREFQPDPFARS